MTVSRRDVTPDPASVDISTTGLIRDQAMILARHPDGVHECLYRTRHIERVETAMSAISVAFDRGKHMGRIGWPERHGDRPLFGLYAMGDDHVVRLMTAMGDAELYRSPSRIDADLVLTACRRACSIAALLINGHKTR